MKYTLLIFTFLLLSCNFCNAQSKRTPTVISDGGGMTAEELKSHNARRKMEDEKQKLRSQAAKTASNEKLAKWKSDQKKATEEAIKEDAKNTIHLTGSDDDDDAKVSNYYYPTKSQAQLQAEEFERIQNNAMNNVNYYLNKIATRNREKIDAREKEKAKERVLADKARKQKIKDDYDEEIRQIDIKFAGTFSNGLAPTSKDGGYIYINREGKKAIPGKFDHANSFHKGFAIVGTGGKYDYKRGVINTSGDLVIPFNYDFISDFDNGLALVEKNDKWGFIDINDNEIIPIIYDDLNAPSKNRQAEGSISGSTKIIFAELDGKYGYIDLNNNVVIPFISSKYAAKERVGDNNEVIFRSKDSYDEISDYHEGLARVQKGFFGYEGTVDEAIFGYVDQTGNQVIPLNYEGGWHFSEGLASVTLNGKTGCIDKEGNKVIPFIFDGVGMFKNGLAIVATGSHKSGWKKGVIDKKGNIIMPLEYTYLGWRATGLLKAQLTDDGDYGLIDINNKVIVPFILNSVESFENGIAKVGVPVDEWDKTEWFYIDNKGNCVKDCDKDIRNPIEKVFETNEVKEYYENGQLSSIGRKDKENGFEIGEWKYYYENGQLKNIVSYERVKQTGGWYSNEESGECKYYNENGQLSSIGSYEEGNKSGEWKTFFENEQLSSIGSYENGKETGEWKKYYENGELDESGRYENGTRIGVYNYYYENGQLSIQRTYENGSRNGVSKVYYENGQLEQIQEYKNDLQHGGFKIYYENGQIKKIGSVLNRKYSGELKEYNENGKLVKTTNY